MKKTFIFTLCVAAIATSCAKEIEISSKEDSSENQLGSLESVTIIASTPSTKTSVDALGQYSWTDNETILVADGTDTPKTFTIDNNNKDKGYFSGSKSGDLRYAVSPVDVLPATLLYDSGSEDLLNLPAEYNYVEGKTNSTMIAGTPSIVGEKYQFEFRHVGSLMKYTIANVPIRTKYFKLTTDQNIAGDEIAFDASKVTEIATSDITTNASKSIVINLPHAVSKANQTMSFYVPVPTGTYNTVKAQLCMANDDVLAEKNKTISGGLELNRTDIFAAPTISLASATITKGNEYKFQFGGTKKFDSWGTPVTQNSMSWTLNKVTVEGGASCGSWDGDGRGQLIGTGSSGSKVTSVSLSAFDYADYCESSTAVGVKEIHVKAGAKNGNTITCTVSVGGVAMSAKETNSDKYTAASLLPGTMTFTSESLLTGDIEITYELSSAGALYLNDITINPDLRTDVSLSFASSLIAKTTANYGSFTGQTATSSPDVDAITNNITYEKSDPSSIISSLNASTGVLALNGTTGTATITARFAGDGTYKPASRSYTIIVTTAGSYSLAHTFKGGGWDSSYQTYTGKTGSATGETMTWTLTLAGNSSSLGVNKNKTNQAKMTLGDTYEKVGTPLGYTKTQTYITAVISENTMSNIGKIEVDCGDTSWGTIAPEKVGLVYSTTGTTYTLIENQDYDSDGNTFTFSPIASAYYAVVIYTSATMNTSKCMRLDNPQFKYYSFE